MSKKTLFVITEKSEMERWDITRSRLNINQTMLEGMTAGLVRKANQVVDMSLIQPEAGGYADLAIGANGYCMARMPVFVLPMSAPFAIEGTTMFPAFDGPHPVMVQRWVVPTSMRLYLCAHITSGLECTEQFLVAIDQERKCYRLPVSNLYADCRLCSGRFANTSDSIVKLLQQCYTQFMGSSWNSDLYGDSTPLRRTSTKAMFSYTVSTDKITQNIVPTKWTSLCEKVSTQLITDYINY